MHCSHNHNGPLLCYQVLSECTCDEDVQCTCNYKCACGSVWCEEDILEHNELIVYSHPALTSGTVQYWVRPCSSSQCQNHLAPEGLSCGLLIFDSKMAFDHQWLFEKMDDIDIDGTTESASYNKMHLFYVRSEVSHSALNSKSLLCSLLQPQHYPFMLHVQNMDVMLLNGMY